MKSNIRIAVALGLMIFFLIGHTIGTLTRKNVKTESSVLTIKAMESTYVELPGGVSNHTMDQFYQGMSLSLDISILLVIALLVICLKNKLLDGTVRTQILLFLTFWMSCISMISFLLIFPIPAVTCLLAAICLGYECLLVPSNKKG